MDSLRRTAWKAYRHLAMVIGLGSLAAFCLAWMPFAMLLQPLLPARVGQALGRRVITVCMRMYIGILEVFCACRIDLSALDALRHAGPLVIAPNHPSLLDAILFLSRLPNTVCVMKASVMDNLLFGAVTRLARYIRNDGRLMQIVAQSREALHGGGQLLLFPEGTRTTQWPLNPCQPTVALIAKRAGVPVQTVFIEYSSPYLGKHWPLWLPPQLPLHCRVRLGERFDPPTDTAAFTAQLEAYFRAQLAPAPAAPRTAVPPALVQP